MRPVQVIRGQVGKEIQAVTGHMDTFLTGFMRSVEEVCACACMGVLHACVHANIRRDCHGAWACACTHASPLAHAGRWACAMLCHTLSPLLKSTVSLSSLPFSQGYSFLEGLAFSPFKRTPSSSSTKRAKAGGAGTASSSGLGVAAGSGVQKVKAK